MRVLYVLPSLLTGGAESLVTQWTAFGVGRSQAVVCTLTPAALLPGARGPGCAALQLNHDRASSATRLRRKYDPGWFRPWPA